MPFEKELEELNHRREKTMQMGRPEKVKLNAQKEQFVEQMIKDSAPYLAAGMHYIHDVIDPRDTRNFIIRSLQVCRNRRTGGVGQHRLANWPTKF